MNRRAYKNRTAGWSETGSLVLEGQWPISQVVTCQSSKSFDARLSGERWPSAHRRSRQFNPEFCNYVKQLITMPTSGRYPSLFNVRYQTSGATAGMKRRMKRQILTSAFDSPLPYLRFSADTPCLDMLCPRIRELISDYNGTAIWEMNHLLRSIWYRVGVFDHMMESSENELPLYERLLRGCELNGGQM